MSLIPPCSSLIVSYRKESSMSNTLIWFWSGFTIVFMLVVMGWFIYKMVKLSKQKSTPLEYEDD